MSHRYAWFAMRGAAAGGSPAHGGLMDLLRIVGTVGARRGLTGAGSSLARPQGRPPGRLFFERSISQQTVYDSNRERRSDPAGQSYGGVFSWCPRQQARTTLRIRQTRADFGSIIAPFGENCQ